MLTKAVAIIAVILFLAGIDCQGFERQENQSRKLILNQQELNWLAEHPTIQLAFPPNIPPYSQTDSQGGQVGFIHEWFAMINSEIGSNIEIVPRPIIGLLKGLENGHYDGVAGVTYSANIKDDSIYTDEVVPGLWSIYTHQNAISYSEFSQIAHQSIGILKGSTGEFVLRSLYPNIKITSYPSYLSALSAVEKGEIFAVFGESRVLNRIVTGGGIYGVIENFVTHDLNVRTGTKIRKDWPILVSIINKAQMAIPKSKLDLLLRKWLKPGLELEHLTLEEIKWLSEKESIKVNFYDAPPYLFNNRRRLEGFLIDYFLLFESKLGLKFNWNIVPFERGLLNDDGTFPETALALPKTRFQGEYVYTRPFFDTSFGLFTRVDHQKITDFDMLNDHVVGFMRGAQGELRREFLIKHRGVSAKIFIDFSSMVKALSLKEIDSFYAETSVARSFLSRNMIQSIALNWFDTDNVVEQSVAVRKDLAPLVDILSKTETQLNKRSLALVFEKWLVGNIQLRYKGESVQRISYTTEEKNWIASNPVVKYSDVTWRPYIQIDENGVVSGIGKEFLDKVEKDSGLKFQFEASSNFDMVLGEVKSGRFLLAIAAAKTPDREQQFDFSLPYISSPLAIVTTDKYAYAQTLDRLAGLRVAIPKGLFIESVLQSDYPDTKLVFTETILESLELVSKGNVDAFIGSLPVVASHLRMAELYNLQVAGLSQYKLDVRFMLAKGQPELLSILDKTISSIPALEKQKIANQWFSVIFQSGIDKKLVFSLLTVGGVVVLVSLFWIRRLKLEIMQKTLVEKALKSARVDAELANKAKSEFLANMSHEIRTPMNAIVGFSNLLSESKLNAKQQAYLRSIRVGSNGLLHIINDILDLSKIEAGKISIEYEATDLTKVVEELELLFFSGMKDKGITFSTKIDNKVPQYLMLDVNRLRQILLNVIGNAQKFTDYGRVDVRIHVSNIEDNCDSVDLFINVKDSGIGIEQRALQRVFNNFEQHEQSQIYRYGGTGLGLAISRKLAEKMSGQLTVVSEVGKGSCFTLRLNQVKIAEKSSTTPEKNRSYEFDKSTVLIVDDVESNQILLTKYLEKYPFEIFIAKNGLQAVDLAEKIKPDIVLMDIRMPKMDGYEATRLIKSKYNTIVVALTASALEDEQSRQKQQIFDAFLRKPILKSKLISVMADFLSPQYQVSIVDDDEALQIALCEQDLDFNRYVIDEFLSKIKTEHKRGNVDKITRLAENLRTKSKQSNNTGLTRFADQLAIACDAFDVEKIDYLINLLFIELKC